MFTKRQMINVAMCLAIALPAAGCSTRPRTFSATVTPVDAAAPLAQSEVLAFTDCDNQVRRGRKSGFASAAVTGAATTVGLYGGAGIATSGIAGGSLSAAGATAAAAVPIIGFAAAFGMNRLIRSGRERKYKRTMATCMNELGYTVIDWTKVPKKQPATAKLAPPPTRTEMGSPAASTVTPAPALAGASNPGS